MAGGKINRPLMATVWLPDLNYGVGMLPLCTMLVPCHYCHPLNTLPLLWRGAVVQQQQLLGRHPHTIFQWLQTFWLVQIVTRDQGRPCDWSQMLTRSPLIWLSGWNLTRVDPGSSDGWQCGGSVTPVWVASPAMTTDLTSHTLATGIDTDTTQWYCLLL